jgi:hypothetical protein
MIQASHASSERFESARLSAFKRVIQFDRAVQSESKNEYIDLDLTRLEAPPQLNGWKVVQHQLAVQRGDGSKSLYWQFEKETGSLTIIITLYKPGSDSAAMRFLEIADSTTTLEIPYIKGPSTIGTLSATDKESREDIFWFFENACVELTRFRSDVPHIDIALWLHRQLAEHRRPMSRREQHPSP